MLAYRDLEPEERLHKETAHFLLRGTPPSPRTISYIIAAYRAEAFLEACVESVLKQQLPEGWTPEVMLGVDGCPATLEVAKKYVEHPQCKVVNMTRNVGTYVTANTLVAQSTGHCLCPVGADDVLLPGRSSAVLEAMYNNHYAMVNTYLVNVTEEGQVTNKAGKAPDGTWCYRRDLWYSLGGWEPWRCGADTHLATRAGSCASRVVLRQPLYGRRSHAGQLTKVLGRRTPERTFAMMEVSKENQRLLRGELPTLSSCVLGEHEVL